MKDEKGRTIRPVLKPDGRGKKVLDMEEVYRLLDEGRTVEDVAKLLGVARSTVYKRHKEYQELIQKEGGLPPLPDGDEWELPPLPDLGD